MTAEGVVTTELARATTDFTYYFRSLVSALGDRPGWYGVFTERQPAAARAYENGTEVPPWDVVRAVLHDLAAAHGAAPDPAEAARARALHQAAVAAWDAAPGAEQALRARLEAAARAHDLALRREREAARALDHTATAPTPAATARLTNLLAWSRDDRERAAARRDELWSRLTAITTSAPLPGEGDGCHVLGDGERAGGGATEGAVYGERDGRRTVPGPGPDHRSRAPFWGRPAPGDPQAGPEAGPGGGRGHGSEYRDPARPGPGAGPGAPRFGAGGPGSWLGGGIAPAGTRPGPQDPGPGFGGGTAPGGTRPGPGGPGGGAGTADDFGWMFRDPDGAQRAEDEDTDDTSGSMFQSRTGDGGRSGHGDPGKPVRAPRFAGVSQEEPPPAAAQGARFAGVPARSPAPGPAVAEEAAGKRGGRTKPRGARFAGAPAAPAAQVPTVPAVSAKATPRGARFAGAPHAPAAPEPKPVDPRWAAEARAGAARLGELRRTGQSGAAYLVLCEAAEGPAERLPYLARELDRTGLSADVATLLWEIAALPPVGLAAAATALAADERPEDCRTLLHQAAARPAPDIAEVAVVLHGSGRADEAGELLETVVRARPPEDAVEVARTAPGLTPGLLAASERISKSRRRDIVAALRRAALPDR